MIIHGTERKFMLTIGASVEVADMCPDGDLSRLGEIFTGSYKKTVETSTKLILALNKGYEDAKAYDCPGYTPVYLTEKEVLSLPSADFKRLQLEAMAAFRADSKSKVELTETKKE